MKTQLQIALMIALGVSSANLLVSCAPKSNSEVMTSPDPALAPTSSSAANSPTTASGTSDSGGGTGIDGKVFESYIVDPTLLPAYKEHLEQMLRNIKGTEGEDTHFHQVLKMKTWYVAPVDLDKIDKDVLGISFVKSETQQIARQTGSEIWINKSIFDQMNLEDQSHLILHELVMNMYLVKFVSISDLCKSYDRVEDENKKESCTAGAASLDRIMPPEKAHPLTEQDNENIRFVTGWILTNAKNQIAEVDFIRILFNNGFDRRLFNPKNYGPQEKNPTQIKISKKEFLDAIRGTENTGNMPALCSSVNGGNKTPCKLEFSEQEVAYFGSSTPAVQMLVSADGQSQVSLNFIINDNVFLSPSRSADDQTELYSLAFADWRNQIKIGDRLYSGRLLFKRTSPTEGGSLMLDAVVLQPGIVFSIDKSQTPPCKVQKPKAVQFWDDVITIIQADAEPSSVVQAYTLIPPFAGCIPENSAE